MFYHNKKKKKGRKAAVSNRVGKSTQRAWQTEFLRSDGNILMNLVNWILCPMQSHILDNSFSNFKYQHCTEPHNVIKTKETNCRDRERCAWWRRKRRCLFSTGEMPPGNRGPSSFAMVQKSQTQRFQRGSILQSFLLSTRGNLQSLLEVSHKKALAFSF